MKYTSQRIVGWTVYMSFVNYLPSIKTRRILTRDRNRNDSNIRTTPPFYLRELSSSAAFLPTRMYSTSYRNRRGMSPRISLYEPTPASPLNSHSLVSRKTLWERTGRCEIKHPLESFILTLDTSGVADWSEVFT